MPSRSTSSSSSFNGSIFVTLPLVPSRLAGDPFDALGDSHRRAIVELLGSGGRTVHEIAESLPISRPAVSRHLRLLKNAGLVIDEAKGTRRIYQLQDKGVEAVQAYLMQVWGDAATRFQLLANNTRRRPRRR
jgi:DNA-binding transcriptional ArsR family regulator